MQSTKSIRINASAKIGYKIRIRRCARAWVLRFWNLVLINRGLIATEQSCFPERDPLFSKPRGIMSLRKFKEMNGW